MPIRGEARAGLDRHLKEEPTTRGVKVESLRFLEAATMALEFNRVANSMNHSKKAATAVTEIKPSGQLGKLRSALRLRSSQSAVLWQTYSCSETKKGKVGKYR